MTRNKISEIKRIKYLFVPIITVRCLIYILLPLDLTRFHFLLLVVSEPFLLPVPLSPARHKPLPTRYLLKVDGVN
jgi:hypothetical protein